MAYRAKVIKVMIASPGDVAAERQVIRNVIQEWNYTHSEDKNLVLMPVGWESHASPAMGDRPQSIINKQVLTECDLLIAVFWTKLGTPTGKAASGTVEEIEEHLKAKKPAMIYFSAVPVRLDSVDEEQYKALRAFKEELRQRGLYAEYESIEEFREKLSRQLAQTVLHRFAPKKNGADHDVEDDAEPITPRIPALSEQAKRLLVEAAEDRRGVVFKLRRRSGLGIHTNGKNLAEDSPRETARWERAIQELLDTGLLQSRGQKNEVFAVTDQGYRIAELVKEQLLVAH